MHTGLVALQTPRRDGGNHRANLNGVGGTPGSRPVSLLLGGCLGRGLLWFILLASPFPLLISFVTIFSAFDEDNKQQLIDGSLRL